uniref:Ig-like domain-containing protein n=1 Tax=Globodera pallida TaxID=36090 RepID=A0A183CI34_GLOPA
MASRPSGAIPSLFLLSAIWPLHFLPYSFSTAANEHHLRPIILDQSQCPRGWSTAGDQCVQLQFVPTRREQVDERCESLGAQLADVADGEGEANREMLQDLSDLLEESLEAGVNELIWMVGAGMLWPEWDETGERVRFGSFGEGQRQHGDETRKVLALQQKRLRGDGRKSRFEVIIVQPPAVHPFICQLLPLWRRLLLYEQSMLPKGVPRLEEQPRSSYYFDPNSPDTNSSFLSLPCSASGSPSPTVRWFRNGGEEIDLHSQSARFIVSGGTLRGHSTTVRPAFIEPFQELRLDAYPLMAHGRRAGGTKLECNAPTHYPSCMSKSDSLGGRMKRLLGTGDGADVNFLVGKGDEQELLPAHTQILMASSDVSRQCSVLTPKMQRPPPPLGRVRKLRPCPLRRLKCA